MAPTNNPPLAPDLEFPDETLIKALLVGRWVTSFDLQFPNVQEGSNPGDPSTVSSFTPTSFLAFYVFKMDGTFDLHQRRNKGGVLDQRHRSGTYEIEWDDRMKVPVGHIAIQSTDNLTLRFIMRNYHELSWIMEGSAEFTPVAQGKMFKAELIAP